MTARNTTLRCYTALDLLFNGEVRYNGKQVVYADNGVINVALASELPERGVTYYTR